MVSAKFLIVLTTLVVLEVAQVGVMASLYKNCLSMGKMVGWSTIDKNDPKKVFAYGKSYLRDMFSPSTIMDRQRLISAWHNVIKKARCSKSSWAEVAIIARCRPHTENSLRTFYEATRSYVKKCLTPEYVEKKIDSESAGVISNTLFGDATKFIDAEFIKNYRAHNPDERPLHTGVVSGSQCCEPERAMSAIVDAMKRDLHKSGDEIKAEFAYDKEKLKSYLDKHLFTPCKRYESALGNIMFDIFHMSGSGLIPGGEEYLFESLSLERQGDVLRTKLCENLHYSEDRHKLVSLVSSWLKKTDSV